MNRRTFSKTLAGGTLGTAALSLEPLALAARAAADSNPAEAPFKISIMLWTVLHELPFEERLEKVAEAGYRAVELVGEYLEMDGGRFSPVQQKTRRVGHHL
jgi:hydroxypyruvate isomerase